MWGRRNKRGGNQRALCGAGGKNLEGNRNSVSASMWGRRKKSGGKSELNERYVGKEDEHSRPEAELNERCRNFFHPNDVDSSQHS